MSYFEIDVVAVCDRHGVNAYSHRGVWTACGTTPGEAWTGATPEDAVCKLLMKRYDIRTWLSGSGNGAEFRAFHGNSPYIWIHPSINTELAAVVTLADHLAGIR